jgi:hypothetical protein
VVSGKFWNHGIHGIRGREILRVRGKFFGCAGNFCKPREINILFNHRDTETTEEKRYEGAVG